MKKNSFSKTGLQNDILALEMNSKEDERNDKQAQNYGQNYQSDFHGCNCIVYSRIE